MVLRFPNFQSWLWRANPNPQNSQTSSPADGQEVTEGCKKSSRSATFRRNKKSGTVAQSARRSGSVRRRRAGARRRLERAEVDCDTVLVSSDTLSESNSEDSDWSIGWFEPHAPEFCSESESDSSFAVLVPCYASPETFDGKKQSSSPLDENPSSKSQLWAAVLSNMAKDSQADTNHHLQQWLSSLQG